MSTVTLDPPASKESEFTLKAIDVTGTITLSTRDMNGPLRRRRRQTIASRMQLPSNVPWGLRSDATGAFLSEDEAIGDQLQTGDRVVVTPETHLGAA